MNRLVFVWDVSGGDDCVGFYRDGGCEEWWGEGVREGGGGDVDSVIATKWFGDGNKLLKTQYTIVDADVEELETTSDTRRGAIVPSFHVQRKVWGT